MTRDQAGKWGKEEKPPALTRRKKGDEMEMGIGTDGEALRNSSKRSGQSAWEWRMGTRGVRGYGAEPRGGRERERRADVTLRDWQRANSHEIKMTWGSPRDERGVNSGRGSTGGMGALSARLERESLQIKRAALGRQIRLLQTVED